MNFYEKIHIPNETLYEKIYTKCNFIQYVTVYEMKLYTKCDVIRKEIIQKVTVYQLNFDEKFSTKRYRIRKIFDKLKLILRFIFARVEFDRRVLFNHSSWNVRRKLGKRESFTTLYKDIKAVEREAGSCP